jgi:hypothetical protein
MGFDTFLHILNVLGPQLLRPFEIVVEVHIIEVRVLIVVLVVDVNKLVDCIAFMFGILVIHV